VVELDALAQLEGPLQRAVLLPFGGQPRDDVELLVARDEELVDLAVEGVGERLVLRVGIHRLRIALAGPAQGLRLRKAGTGNGGGCDERSKRSALHGSSCVRKWRQCR